MNEKLYGNIEEILKEQARIRSLIKIFLDIYENDETSIVDGAVIVRILKEKIENVFQGLNTICQNLESNQQN